MTDRPNILFLLPDQLRPDFVGCFGANFIATPRIDALAADGTRYETCISPSPICVPARASMLTGLAAHATGVTDNIRWLRPDRREIGIHTWPELLSEAGYTTASIGKMHFYPWDLGEGFAHRIIAEDKLHIHIEDDYHDALAAAGYRRLHGRDMPGYTAQKGATENDLPDDLQVDRWVADKAAACFSRLPKDQPFAMMVGFPSPHCPYDPSPAALAAIDPAKMPLATGPNDEARALHSAMVASYKRGWADVDYSELEATEIQRIRHHYAALVQTLDRDVGVVLDALAADGRLDNTIVVFASDHGDYLGDFGLIGKTYFHEPSLKVPLIVRDFRQAARGTVEQAPASLLDLFPSFLSWAGVPVPEVADGSVLGQAPSDRILVGQTTHGIMARDPEWKLVRYRNGVESLYHIAADPCEEMNWIDARPKIRARLDLAITDALLSGFSTLTADLRVPAAQASEGNSFYRRGWQRPYPARI
ncbi:MAG: sulfatase-like hydrolase/transferase [Pseudomonadota bacterium]